MKKLLQLTALATLIAPALVACGAAPTFNANAPQLRSAQLLHLLRAPQQAPRFARQNDANEINAEYWLGQVLSSGYSPDHNNSQFGMNYLNISYMDYVGSQQNTNHLQIMYPAQQNELVFSVSLVTAAGTPEEKREHFSHKDSEKVRSLTFFLSTLMTRNDKDTANLQRVLNIFAEALGEAPRTPAQVGGRSDSAFQSQARRR